MTLDNIILNDTIWGSEATKLNANFAKIQVAITELEGTIVSSGVKSVNNTFPDASGNVSVTISSLGGIPVSAYNQPLGVPRLNASGKIPESLVSQVNGNKYAGFASTSTSPEKGQFFYATAQGTYTNFKNSSNVAIQVSEEDLKTNIVVLSSSGNYWVKQLIPIHQQTFPAVRWQDITGKPAFAAVATSGNYNDLLNLPTYAAVALSGKYTDLTDTPAFAAVALSGKYTDLTNVPEFWAWSKISNKPEFAAVATSGSYNDLLNKPELAAVATSGSYNDLTDKPTIISPQSFDVPDGIPTLDSAGMLRMSEMSSEIRNQYYNGFIGTINPGTNLPALASLGTMNIFGFVTVPYAYLSGQIVVTNEELKKNLVIIMGKNTFQKVLIPYPQQVVGSVTSVNGNTGDVVISIDGLGGISNSRIGQANGVCPLNGNTKIDKTYLPSPGGPNGVCMLDAAGRVPQANLGFSTNSLLGILSDFPIVGGAYDLNASKGYALVDIPATATQLKTAAGVSLSQLVQNIVMLNVTSNQQGVTTQSLKFFKNNFERVSMSRSLSSGPNYQTVTAVSDYTFAAAKANLNAISTKRMTIADYGGSNLPGLILDYTPAALKVNQIIDLSAVLATLVNTTQAAVDRLENLWGTAADL